MRIGQGKKLSMKPGSCKVDNLFIDIQDRRSEKRKYVMYKTLTQF
jgi:hypothetical protein